MTKAFALLKTVLDYKLGDGCVLCLTDAKRELSENVTALFI